MRFASRDDGMTLVELMIGLGLLAMVLAFLLSALTHAQNDYVQQVDRVDSNDQLRAALQAMDHEIRSGDILYSPSGEQYPAGCSGATCQAAPYYSFRVLSETNVPAPRDEKRCVQFRVTSVGLLQRRDWDPNWTNSNDPVQVTGWRTLASGVLNYPGAPAPYNTPSSYPFTRPSYGGAPAANLVFINLWVNPHPGNGVITGRISAINGQISISGRNSAITTDLQQCGPQPPDPALFAGGARVPPY